MAHTPRLPKAMKKVHNKNSGFILVCFDIIVSTTEVMQQHKLVAVSKAVPRRIQEGDKSVYGGIL
jgi:hypothetical protein